MSESPPQPNQGEQATSPAGAQNTGTGQSSENMVPQSRFNEINARAKAAQEELDRLKAEKQAEDEKRAKEQGKFEELANKHAATVAELRPQVQTLTAERDELLTVLSDHVKELRKGIPDEFVELLDNLSVVKQLAWITKNREKVTGTPTSVPRGNGQSPRPAGSPNQDERVRENRDKLAATGFYTPF